MNNNITYGFRGGHPATLEDLQGEVGKGWNELIARLVTDLFALGWNGTVVQIKEKFGGLRFQGVSGSTEIYKCITKAEDESFNICEECGTIGNLRGGGWLKTLCDEHANGRKLYDEETD